VVAWRFVFVFGWGLCMGEGGYVITAKDGIGGCGVGSGDPGHDTGYLSFFRRVIGNIMLREPVRRRLRLCPHDGTVDT